MRGERIQLPLVYKTVHESGEMSVEAPISSPRGQEAEKTVLAVVANNHGCFAGEADVVHVLQGGE